MKNINFFREFFQRYPHLKFQKNSIKHSFELLNRHLKNKNFLFIIGNGGSASDSDHIAGELLKGFKLTRSLKKKNQLSLGLNLFKNIQNALSVIPLTNFNAFNTAFGNDCNFDYTFAQLVWALGSAEDVILCISTSGNSKNIINAANVAKFKNLKIISFTNYFGGTLKSVSHVNVNVPEIQTFKTQELHLPIYHIISILIEESFFGLILK